MEIHSNGFIADCGGETASQTPAHAKIHKLVQHMTGALMPQT